METSTSPEAVPTSRNLSLRITRFGVRKRRERNSSKDVFSLSPLMLNDILRYAKPLGHNEEPRNLNLGFGFLYYGIARALRPKHVLVVGSGYGFSVVCFALGMKDNGVGCLSFVDPSYSVTKDGPFKTIGGRGKWNDCNEVQEHFKRFAVHDIVTHYKMRSDELFPQYATLGLPPIDVAFIDGGHSYKCVKYDFLAVLQRSHKNTYIFLHDTNIYVREMLRNAGVKRWMKVLAGHEKALEIINFPFSSGVAIVRVVDPKIWKVLQ